MDGSILNLIQEPEHLDAGLNDVRPHLGLLLL